MDVLCLCHLIVELCNIIITTIITLLLILLFYYIGTHILDIAFSLRSNLDFWSLNYLGTLKDYGDFGCWTECILYYEIAMSLLRQKVMT